MKHISMMICVVFFLNTTGCAIHQVKPNRVSPETCGEKIPCPKDKPRPVCFSCEEAYQVLKAKERLKAWPEKCRQSVKYATDKQKLSCKKKLDQAEEQIKALRKKRDAQAKTGLEWVLPSVLALGLGFGIGFLVRSLVK